MDLPKTIFSGTIKIGILLILILLITQLAFPKVPLTMANNAYESGTVTSNSFLTAVAGPTFGIIGSAQEKPALRNLYWLFGNESISYNTVSPAQITSPTSLTNFSGLIVWTKQGGFNASSILQFAKNHVVIADTRDFCNNLYPYLNSSMQIVTNNTVKYNLDWGNFRSGDIVYIKNETGNSNRLTSVLTSSLKTLSNITVISQFDSSRTASFFLNTTQSNSGFYVMDLDATTNSTEFTGIWHLIPAVKMVKDFQTGKYAIWMGNGQQYYDLQWIYDSTNALAKQNSDLAKTIIIGKTVQGRNITALFIGHGSKYAIIDGAIHGNEKTGAFACLRTAELLINYYRSDPYWKTALSEYTIIAVPVLNPDGFANDSRYNANGIDLNSQFPPDKNPTQPEALALINLMGECKPSIYVNMHEGYYWYPSEIIYGNYENASTTTQTIAAVQAANKTFISLNHYGRFTEGGTNVLISKVNTIARGGKEGMAISYASYQYQASCMLIETFVWSNSWGARQCLWAMDFYPCIAIAFLQEHIPPRFVDDFESGSFSNWDGNYITSGSSAAITQTLRDQGKYSAMFTSNGPSTEQVYYYKSLPYSLNVYTGAYFYVSQYGIIGNTSHICFIEFCANGTNVAYTGWQQIGASVKWVLAIKNATEWAITYSNTSPSTGKWYHIELYWIKDNTRGQAQLFINGDLACSIKNANTSLFGDTNQIRLGLPEISGCSVASVYVDLCMISRFPTWDINQDGAVNLLDLVILAEAYGSKQDSATWKQMADINGDGTVELQDLVTLCLHFQITTA
jgi:hypothetical protein